MPSAVYGLAEIDREEIVNAKLVANPGCYATCAILSIYPLIKEGIIDINSIIIDAKSGVTGAGRNATVDSLFCEVNETMKAYKTASHRHIPEIESIINEYTSAKNFHLVFNPHLIPIERGIYVDAYAKLNKNLTALEIIDIFKKYYGNEKFVRIYDENTTPEVR
ncbi:hypothetical protein FACS189459_5960 [Bacilli bacterium]|nr:hypothetical protein FACS189459_5960 [Bacilli bacterium]GHU53792.1 hypothetical protein FACS189496_5290 [Bacilli bacterium]